MIQLTRNLFFYTDKGTLRFSENSPEKKQCEHQVCNCTKAVTERPDGEPNSKQQYVQLNIKDNDYTYEVGLAEKGCEFTLRWPGEVITKGHNGPTWSSKNHAYYWFNRGVKNSLNIEIIKKGYGRTDCFFGHIYRGNKIDISEFFNGHSKSRVVDLSKIGTDEIWAHFCGINGEATCSFKECEETELWRAAFNIHKDIGYAVSAYDGDFESSVDRIRENVENDKVMLERAEGLCEWFSWVTKNLEKTEMFYCADYCYQNTWQKILEK